MNLADFDLNLLVVLDAIYEERNLTRAGQRLGLSQPAVSHSLNKLRQAFADPLFVRNGYLMEPTPLSEELRENVKAALELTARTLADRGRFEPARSCRTFNVGIQDYPMVIIMPRLMRHLKTVAPGITIRTFHMSMEERRKALEEKKLDLVVGIRQDFGSSIFQQHLFDDSQGCLVRQGHPVIGDELTLEQYLEADFIGLSISDTQQAIVDRLLKEMGHRRNIRLTVENEVTIPQLVAATDFVANIAWLVAKEYLPWLPLRILPLPIHLEELRFFQYWHDRHHQDPGHVWLRQTIKQLCSP